MSALSQEYPFYRGAGRMEALDMLCDAGLRGGFVVMTGPDGAGVSRLLGEAAMTLVDSAAVVRVDGNDTPSRNVLMRALLSHFGVAKEEFAATLERALASEPLVLVVDNASGLGEEALSTLGVLRERLGPRFALLLGGVPETGARLAEAGLTPTDRIELAPLTADECADFLAYVTGEELDDEDAELRWQQSGGWPGALLAQAPPPVLPMSRLSGFRVPWKHLAAVGGLLLVVILFWPRDKAEEEVRSLALPPRTLPETVTAPEREPAAPAPERPAVAPQPPAQAASPADDRIASPAAEPDEPVAPPRREAPAEPPARVAAPAETPASPARPAAEAPQEPAAPAVVRADQPPSLTGLDAELGYRREEWLLGAPASQWMLQVTLAGTEDAARALADQLGAGKSAYYRASRNDRNVYIVLAGPYADRAAAVAGRADLPSALAAAGPFPRQIEAIQQELGGN